MSPWAVMVVVFAVMSVVVVVVNRAVFQRARSQGLTPPGSSPPPDPSHTFDPDRSVRIRGAALRGKVAVSWPFVVMTIDDQWTRVRGPFIGTVWIPRHDVVAIEELRTIRGAGLHVRSVSGAYDDLLLTVLGGSLRAAFGRFGWPLAGVS
jgi:hypothetical protein